VVELLSPTKSADLLGCKKNTLAIWRLKGTGPVFVRVGSRVMYAREDLEKFIATRKRCSTSDVGAAE